MDKFNKANFGHPEAILEWDLEWDLLNPATVKTSAYQTNFSITWCETSWPVLLWQYEYLSFIRPGHVTRDRWHWTSGSVNTCPLSGQLMSHVITDMWYVTHDRKTRGKTHFTNSQCHSSCPSNWSTMEIFVLCQSPETTQVNHCTWEMRWLNVLCNLHTVCCTLHLFKCILHIIHCKLPCLVYTTLDTVHTTHHIM